MRASLAIRDQQGLLGRVDVYQHPELVERLQRKLSITKQEALELFSDTKRYLYLCSIAREALAPTQKIDQGWHEFLMFTRDYAAFCKEMFGTFIHHTPTPKLGPRLVANPSKTIGLAKQHFSVLSSNWSTNQTADCESDCAPDSDCHGDGSCGGDV